MVTFLGNFKKCSTYLFAYLATLVVDWHRWGLQPQVPVKQELVLCQLYYSDKTDKMETLNIVPLPPACR